MIKNWVKNAFMSVALAGSAALGGCVSVHNLDTDRCVQTDGFYPKPNLPPIVQIFQGLMPSFTHVRPSMPCVDSQYFMALVGISHLDGNDNNYHVQGAIVGYYDEMANMAKTDNYAAKTLSMIDGRLAAQNTSIDAFRQSYDRNRPRTVSTSEERDCSMVTMQVNGQLVDERVCGFKALLPAPAR